MDAIAAPAHPRRRRLAGFTLLELMITLAVIAVLASIAYASYQNNVINSRRAVAAACLLEGAQFMERYYTTRLTYVGGNPWPALSCDQEVGPYYSFPATAASTATTTGYSLTAVPINQQLARDTACGTLGIDHRGRKTISGTGQVATCW